MDRMSALNTGKPVNIWRPSYYAIYYAWTYKWLT